jgi:hypothetical protein
VSKKLKEELQETDLFNENNPNPTSGGSDGIEIANVPVLIEDNNNVGVEAEQEAQSPEMSEALAEVNSAIIETGVKTLSKVAVMITKIPELEFTEEEIEQLKVLWTPQIPTMSPLTGAIVGTLLIVAGKVAIYAKYKDRRKDMTVKDYVKEEEKLKDATIQRQKEAGSSTETSGGSVS